MLKLIEKCVFLGFIDILCGLFIIKYKIYVIIDFDFMKSKNMECVVLIYF